MSWLELLERGKRMDINIPLVEKNPGYYTQAEQLHAGMSFVSTDGIHWYVSADGNHRSCLARFLFHLQGEERTQLHNVAQSIYHADRASGLPVGKFTIWLMFSPGMVCIFVCRPGGRVFPAKTWPAGKWTVSEQRLS